MFGKEAVFTPASQERGWDDPFCDMGDVFDESVFQELQNVLRLSIRVMGWPCLTSMSR